jgi:beta-glucosidase
MVLNAGDAGYDPLFPLGYGMTYGERSNLPPLTEDTTGVDLSGAQPNLHAGTHFLAEAAGEPVAITGLPARSAGGAVAVEALQAPPEVGPMAVRVSFSGSAAGEVFTRHPQALDLRRQSNGNLAIAMAVNVLAPPSGPLTLGMGCGEGCGGAVDVSGLLRKMPAGEWQTLTVRLRCIAEAGADMGSIETPVRLGSAGAAQIGLGKTELVSASESSEPCPPRHPPG